MQATEGATKTGWCQTHDQMFLEGSEKCPVVAQPSKAMESDKGRSATHKGLRKRHRRGRTEEV